MDGATSGLTAGLDAIQGERLRRIDGLDLEPVVYKLVWPDSAAAELTLAVADMHVGLYRCFLKVCVLHPEAPIVPSKVIDEVWHAHLLDTAKYRADCDVVFGYFLDHFPYAGLRGDEDRAAWLEDFANTRRLFLEDFGVDVGPDAGPSVCRNHGSGSECVIGCMTRSDNAVRPRPARAPLSMLNRGSGIGGRDTS